MPGKATDPFPVMENMTVKEIRAYLERRQSIIVPIGITEQHGYHLPLKTDALVATELGRRIGARTGILVAPTVLQSFSGGGLPGTINISPAVMSLVLSDMMISLVAQGFCNLYLFPCHGGSENARALDDALKILLRSNPAFHDVMIALVPVWQVDPGNAIWAKAFGEGDWHAGWLETSLVLALAPDLVRMDELELDTEPWRTRQIEHPDNYQHAEKIVDDPAVVPRLTQRPEIKVGVMGYPERASAKLGRQIVRTLVDAGAKRLAALDAKADGVYKEVEFAPAPLIFAIPKRGKR